jgi:outer membrane biosynthesis protein TonB
MTASYANPEDLSLKKFLVYSSVLHALLVVCIAVSILLNLAGQQWSGSGGVSGPVTNVKLVGPPAGIPMPTQPSPVDSKTADPSKSLWKEDTKPKPPEPPTKAEKIAPFKDEKQKPPTHKSKVDEPRVPPPDNIVPNRGNPPPNLSTNYNTQPGSGSGQPITMQGPGGGGDFASRYGWYIEAVRRAVGQNWLQSTIDPAVRAAHQAHCVMTFRIYRDGSARNIQLQQTSGNLSMDNSARRALDGIQFGPLPNDYSGSYVDVTFDFDLSLTH